MLGPVFNHDTLHLIINALCVHFLVNVNVNQATKTLLNVLRALDKSWFVHSVPSVDNERESNVLLF